MGRSGNPTVVPGARLKRLALSIDGLAEKDEGVLRLSHDIGELRRAAATELYTICRDFAASVNRLLAKAELALDPEQFSDAAFQEDAINLIQLSVRGRILQVAFTATPELISTEDFRVPYTLTGSVRAFNRELLEKEIVKEQLLFYTLEKAKKTWRFFDPRTYRSGIFDQEYLVSVMEQLI